MASEKVHCQGGHEAMPQAANGRFVTVPGVDSRRLPSRRQVDGIDVADFLLGVDR
jgi:hypothetical protein